jgi:WD40 repeat protein
VCTGSGDKTARLWIAATGEEFAKFSVQTFGTVSVAFSPDGTRILTGSKNDTIGAGNSAPRLYWGRSLADSKNDIIGASDNAARLWDMATGKERVKFKGHSGAVTSVAFSPNGKLILTGSHTR